MIFLKVVPEFPMVKDGPKKAGFVPSDEEDQEVELWQLWCRSSETDETRRATFDDLAGAGFVRQQQQEEQEKKKSVGKGKAANKPAGRKQRKRAVGH